MNKKTLIFIIVALVVVVGVGGVYFLKNKGPQKPEDAVRLVVENFGQALKKVSLLSPNAKKDMEKNYKKYLDTYLLSAWENNPQIAVGRLASSPWPERIEIFNIKEEITNIYKVSGRIIETDSQKKTTGQGLKVVQPIYLTVAKIGSEWLITAVTTEQPLISN